MIDYDILEKEFGSTKERIRAVFTAKDNELCHDGEKLLDKQIRAREESGQSVSEKEKKSMRWQLINSLKKHRQNWEKKIQSRLEEGRTWNLKHYRYYFAADMAWDSDPVQPETIPLNLYAKGKVSIQNCIQQLREAVGETEAEKFIIKDADKSEATGIDLPRLHEVSINLVRPYITRRVAAQVNKYNNMFPWLSYESRSKSMVGKLRGAAMSQRAEIMADQYGYRPKMTQWLRDTFLYGHMVAFAECAWDKQKQYRKSYAPDGEWSVDEYIESEGVPFCNPSPTRVFYDMAHPLSSINCDKGCQYLGYWDVSRVGEVINNPSYFNRDQIRYSSSFDNTYRMYKSYFSLYYDDSSTIKFTPSRSMDIETPLSNDLDANTGLLAATDTDTSIILTQYYERVIPSEVGLGDYPFPVWLRLVIANDCTVIYGEFLPSRPAAYMGYNENDSRILNMSMAHEIIPYQDQASNLFSQMIYLMRLESFMMLALDTDLLNEDQVKAVRAYVEGSRYHQQAMMVEFSASEIRDKFRTNPDKPFEFITSRIESQIQMLLQGVTSIISLLERNQLMSPQELGQYTERETSATEVQQVTNTTNALYGFISEGPDEFRAALKRIIYEADQALGSDEVYLPVTEMFPASVVESAGFTLIDEDENALGVDVGNQAVREQIVIRGPRRNLGHDYIFNTRDGNERTVSVEAAKTLFQLLAPVMQNDMILQAIGQKQLFEMISEIFRLSGSAYVLKIPHGEQDQLKGGTDIRATLQQFIEEQVQVNQLNEQQHQELADAVEQIANAIAPPPAATQEPPIAG